MNNKQLLEAIRSETKRKYKETHEIIKLCMEADSCIDALTAQLAESERQRAAAVADLETLMEKTQSAEACYICANDHDHAVCGSNFTRCVPKWRPKWRGPQEAGEGEG